MVVVARLRAAAVLRLCCSCCCAASAPDGAVRVSIDITYLFLLARAIDASTIRVVTFRAHNYQ